MEPNKYEQIVLKHIDKLQYNNDYLAYRNSPMTEDVVMQIFINKAMRDYLRDILKEMQEVE